MPVFAEGDGGLEGGGKSAADSVEAVHQQIAGLNAELEAELAALDTKLDPATEPFETVTLRPKKTGITVRLVALGWRGD